MTAFTLQPFADAHPPISLTGTVERQGDDFAIAYTVTGQLDQITIPAVSSQPTRRYDLWEATCFEFFVGQPTLAPYWEFNLSPAGHWNVFHLEAYRQGLKEESAMQTLPIQIHQNAAALTLTLTLNLRCIIPQDQPLDVGICAVIQSPHFPLSYWAVAHCGPQADFHQRESFVLPL